MGKDTRKPPKSQVTDNTKQYLKMEIANLRGEVQFYREESQRQHDKLVSIVASLHDIQAKTRWSIAKNNNLIRKFLRLVADMGTPPAQLEPTTPPRPAPPPRPSGRNGKTPPRPFKGLPPIQGGEA